MPAGNTPTVSVNGASATVSWTASTFAGGGPAVNGYVVRRFDGATLQEQAIGAGCTGVITALSCVEASVPAGTWVWSVQPVQNNWLGAESSKSASATVAAYRATVLSDSPSVYYRLGEASGTVALDSSGHAQDATYQPAFVTYGVAGTVGDNDTAIISNGGGTPASRSGGAGLPTGNAPRTWELWFKTSAAGNTLVDYGGNPLRANGSSLGIASLGGAPATPNQNDNLWHYVAVTYDGTTLRNYYDGVFVGTQTGSLNTPVNATLRLGNDSGGFAWNGSLDEVAIYPTALSAAKVAAHFAASGLATTSPPTGLTATPGNRSASLSWNAVTSPVPVTYVVRAYLGTTLVATRPVTSPSTTATFTSLDGAATYSFTVSAYSIYGESPASAAVTATTAGTGASYRSVVVADGPLAYWRLDEPMGYWNDLFSAQDYSGNGRALTYGTSGITHAAGGALGDGDHASTGANAGPIATATSVFHPVGGAARSIEVWFKRTALQYDALVAWGQSQDALFALPSNGTSIEYWLATGNTVHANTTNLSDGSFHHAVFTYDGATGKIYVDGVLLVTQTITINSNASSPLQLGSDRFNEHLTGSLDDVALYDYALSGAQVAAHYAARS